MILADTVDGALDLVFKELSTREKKKAKAHFNGLFYFLFFFLTPPRQFHVRVRASKK